MEEEGDVVVEIHQPRIPAMQTRRMLKRLKRKVCMGVVGLSFLVVETSLGLGGSRSGTTGERC